MTETHEEWERRCVEQDVKCVVCGRGPNAECTSNHLPIAITEVQEMKRKAEVAATDLFKYRAAIQQEPK